MKGFIKLVEKSLVLKSLKHFDMEPPPLVKENLSESFPLIEPLLEENSPILIPEIPLLPNEYIFESEKTASNAEFIELVTIALNNGEPLSNSEFLSGSSNMSIDEDIEVPKPQYEIEQVNIIVFQIFARFYFSSLINLPLFRITLI